MPFKIDTKEKFHIICPIGNLSSAIMTDELVKCLENCLTQNVKNVIVTLKDTNEVEDAAAVLLVEMQEKFMEAAASFVVCCANDRVHEKLKALQLDDILNLAPTESEAWDLVHMDEIEREFMRGED
jgi:hypothetical protein